MLDLGILRRSRVRLTRQTEVAECGIAALTMVANSRGLDVDLGTIRRRHAPSLRGTTLRSLMNIADDMGFAPRAVKVPLDQLGKLYMPAILHWDLNHFVVLESVRKGRALIHDPVGRSALISMTEVSQRFTGVALELPLRQVFKIEQARERLRLSQLWRRINAVGHTVTQILMLSIVLQVFVIAIPYYIQISIDDAIPALDMNLLSVLALGFGLFTFFQSGASLLRSYVLLSVGSTLGFSLSSNIARHLFRLPVDWFEKRYSGDILSRFQSVVPVQNILTQGAAAAVVDGLMAILTLMLMFMYSVTLAFVTVGAFALYGLVRAISFSFERDAREAAIVSSGKEQTVLIETIRGISTLRLFGKETLRHAIWQSSLVDVVNANTGVARVSIWQSTLNMFIFGIENIISVWLAVSFVIRGDGFSVGMVFAYNAYKAQFIQRSTSLIDQAVAVKMLGLHLDRLSDIALSTEDASFRNVGNSNRVLDGRIELREVSYRYSASDPIILEGVNLIVEAGEHVAITGPSGSGKSTLAKLMLGLVEPTAGMVLVDGLPLHVFGYKTFREQTGAILQDDRLFSGSLSENIALFDEHPDLNRVVLCAKSAAIHDDIAAMPMGYETLVGDMGSCLSGGQKQRVLFARALYRNPKALVVDEGTAHLDALNERKITEAIRKMGITRIIVAHRQETIATADRVYLVGGGKALATESAAA